MASAVGGEYAQELRALKLELQATITRLSRESSISLSGRRGFQSPPLRVDTAVGVRNEDHEPRQASARTAGTPATTVSTAASSTDDAGGERRGISLAADRSEHVDEGQDHGTDARVVLRELTRAVRRQEQQERQLLEEIQRDNRDDQDALHRKDQRRHHGHRHSSRRRHERKRGIRALHRAIEELQRQRQEILRQIDAETATDRERERVDATRQVDSKSAFQGGHRQTHLPPRAAVAGNDATLDSQYSIGGIVTLEPLRVAEAMNGRAARFPSAQYPQLSAALHTRPQPPPSCAPRVVYPKTLDALNDVFSIQLKFAETMLQLEQSVQARDQLLHGHPSPHRLHRRRRPDSSSRCNVKQVDTSQDGILDTDMSYSGAMSSSSEDDDDGLAGSDVSTVDYDRRQHRRRNRQSSTESSQQASTPSSSADTVRNASGIHSMAATASASASASASARTSPSVLESSRTFSPEHDTPVAVRRSAGAADLTTPSTGSSKKSEASSKQVRFGEDEFPTPLIARKFSFRSSDDDDDDHEVVAGGDDIDDAEAELSVLSLLEGSSVHSSELNDASFLQAFDAFRRELKTESPTRLTRSRGASLSAARALLKTLNEFVTPEKAKTNAAGGSQLQRIDDREVTTDELVRSQVQAKACASNHESKETPKMQQESQPTRSLMSETELIERRRQLCLDIQAESATLALAFSTDERQAYTIRAKLLALRDELSTVEAQLGSG